MFGAAIPSDSSGRSDLPWEGIGNSFTSVVPRFRGKPSWRINGRHSLGASYPLRLIFAFGKEPAMTTATY